MAIPVPITAPREPNREAAALTLFPPTSLYTGLLALPAKRAVEIYALMLRVRALEIRTLKMSKSGEGYFWIGCPGEEAFQTCLGLQVRKGRGPAYDFLHLHYRSSGVLTAMGMPMIDHVRQMAMTATDPHSRGRNFVGHYAVPDWNVLPVSSVIEVQFSMAAGTALVQKRHGDGVTVVTGGEAGTAEADFYTCMTWASRPGHELPVLMVILNNGYGISTPVGSQLGPRPLSERGEPFNIPGDSVDGTDPVASWHAIRRGLEYCRKRKKPYLIEAKVSRLHGHSSSSGGNRVASEADPIELLERRLVDHGMVELDEVAAWKRAAQDEAEAAVMAARGEAAPSAEDVERFTFAPSRVDRVYPLDYTGLPGKAA